MHSHRRAIPVAALGVATILTLTGCAGNSIEGTYYGTAGDTVLIIARDGKCGYTDDYDPKVGLKVKIDKDCSWTLSGNNLTLIGVSSSGSLTGFVGNDGALSIPDQNHWIGEIYSKK